MASEPVDIKTRLEEMNEKVEFLQQQLSNEVEVVRSEQKMMRDKIHEIQDSRKRLNTSIKRIESQRFERTFRKFKSGTDLNSDDVFEETVDSFDYHLAMPVQQIKSISPCYSWKINGIKDVLARDENSIESEEFPVRGYPFKAKAKFSIKEDEYFYISLAFINENYKVKQIPLKVIPKVTYTLKSSNGPEDVVSSYDHLFASALEFHEFYYERWLIHKSWSENLIYVANDTIVIDIAIDPPSVANAIASYNGKLNVAIDNYNFRKQRAYDYLEDSSSSPYFYTSADGFRVRVQIYLIGHGDYRGKGLSAAISFLSGENDDSLSCSFAHKTTVVVFNQLYPTEHLEKTVEKDIEDECDYVIDLLPHNNIENDGFLKDDTLYYKIIIEPL